MLKFDMENAYNPLAECRFRRARIGIGKPINGGWRGSHLYIELSYILPLNLHNTLVYVTMPLFYLEIRNGPVEIYKNNC